MSEIYFTIAGTNHWHGQEFIEPGMKGVVYPMLYHQMEDQIMIHLVTSDEDVEDAAKAFDDIANGTMMPGIDMSEADYTLRMVGTQNQLREKIYIFDSDMDDRAVEMYKLCLKSNMLVKQPEIKVAEMFLEMNDGEPDNFAVRLEDGTWGTMPFHKDMYPLDSAKKRSIINS